MTYSLLDEHPLWKEHQARVEGLNAAERSDRQHLQAEADANQEKLRVWREATREATLAGKPTPKKPEEPDLETGIIRSRTFAAEQEALRAAGNRLLAELAPEIEEQAEARWVEVLPRAQAALAAADRSKAEVEAVLATLTLVRRAKEAQSAEVERPSEADRTKARLTLDEFGAFTNAGVSPFGPTPLPRAESGIQRDNVPITFTPGHADTTVLGLTEKGPFLREPGWPNVRQPLRRPGEI